MMDPEGENIPVITTIDEFLEHFAYAHRDDNFVAIKHGNYSVNAQELEGEVVDWTMQYLEYM